MFLSHLLCSPESFVTAAKSGGLRYFIPRSGTAALAMQAAIAHNKTQRHLALGRASCSQGCVFLPFDPWCPPSQVRILLLHANLGRMNPSRRDGISQPSVSTLGERRHEPRVPEPGTGAGTADEHPPVPVITATKNGFHVNYP